MLGIRHARLLRAYLAQVVGELAGSLRVDGDLQAAILALEDLVEHVPEWSRLDLEHPWSSQRLAADALAGMGGLDDDEREG